MEERQDHCAISSGREKDAQVCQARGGQGDTVVSEITLLEDKYEHFSSFPAQPKAAEFPLQHTYPASPLACPPKHTDTPLCRPVSCTLGRVWPAELRPWRTLLLPGCGSEETEELHVLQFGQTEAPLHTGQPQN